MHRTLAIGSAVLATSMAFAAPAMAQTIAVPLTFDHAVLDTPVTGKAQIVTPSTKPVAVTANVDPTTGDFTVDPSAFSVPPYSFTSPVPGTASIALAKQATGVVDFATGALTMNADFLATINLGSAGSCTIDTGMLTLSTATTKPLPGHAFPAGTTGVATGDGAFGVGWPTLPAGTGQACPLVNGTVDGPGGLWISRGISPVSTPKITVSAAKIVRVRRHRVATVRVTVKNSGAADTRSVKVCLAAKRPLAVVRRCQMVAKPAAGAKHTLAFRVRTNGAKPSAYRLTISATGSRSRTVTLKVTR
ncbi:MAG TPA: hypothetical protein VFN48_10065 [Solirubrobacteraceae bacterium]|nr:hypothetical protein [Solirubrobacteraceae bacterium]